MNISKYILFYLFVLIIIVLFFCSDKNYNYLIHEEAIPIRDYNEIKGMKYTIRFDDSINEKNVSISSKILSSIYHYKDMNSIDSFFVNLDIDDNYKIKSIYIVDKRDNSIIKNIIYEEYNDEIIFNLDKDVFSNYKTYYDIKIDFKKNTRKI